MTNSANTQIWQCSRCGEFVKIRFDPDNLGEAVAGQSCDCGKEFEESSWTCCSPLDD